MRNSIKLTELPEEIQSAVQSTKTNADQGLIVIENGSWHATDTRNYEMKQDILFYLGCFWKHVKCRANADSVLQEITDDGELTQVFPQTQQVVVYM